MRRKPINLLSNLARPFYGLQAGLVWKLNQVLLTQPTRSIMMSWCFLESYSLMHSWKISSSRPQSIVSSRFGLRVIYLCWPDSSVMLPWMTCIKSPSCFCLTPDSGDVRQAICDRATQLFKTQTFSLEITSCPYQGCWKTFPSRYECCDSLVCIFDLWSSLELCHEGFGPGQQGLWSLEDHNLCSYAGLSKSLSGLIEPSKGMFCPRDPERPRFGLISSCHAPFRDPDQCSLIETR